MGGRRKDFDGAFAMLDTNFILSDPRIINLPLTARWVYICLWCLAVRCRRITLADYEVSPSNIARMTKQRPSSIQAAYEQLQNTPGGGLIKCNPDNTITVIGVQDKHPNLKWRNPNKSIYAGEEEEEEEEEKEKEKERDLSPLLESSFNADHGKGSNTSRPDRFESPYNDPKLLTDTDYAAVMCKEDPLSDYDELLIEYCKVWAIYKLRYPYGNKCKSCEKTIIPLLEQDCSIEKLQGTIKAYPKKPSNTPLWKIFKPLESKVDEVSQRKAKKEHQKKLIQSLSTEE